MRLAFIPFLLLIIPIMEIAAFIFIGGQIGIGWTLLMILVTAIGGTFLLRRQGMGLVNRVQTEMGEGRVPGQALGEGLMIIVAGVLLLTPGFITDALGFSLFVPQVRQGLWSLVASKIVVTVPGGGQFTARDFEKGPPPGSPFDGPREDGQDGPVIDLDEENYTSSVKNPDSPWRN
ncbi:MAG: FxsA family protein [Pseudomonadota bacterium]